MTRKSGCQISLCSALKCPAGGSVVIPSGILLTDGCPSGVQALVLYLNYGQLFYIRDLAGRDRLFSQGCTQKKKDLVLFCSVE